MMGGMSGGQSRSHMAFEEFAAKLQAPATLRAAQVGQQHHRLRACAPAALCSRARTSAAKASRPRSARCPAAAEAAHPAQPPPPHLAAAPAAAPAGARLVLAAY
jgi:hypothetical protein